MTTFWSHFAILLFSVIFNLNVQSEYIWSTVTIMGGGYVLEVIQSLNGTIYSRTDVGGIYKYHESNEWWQELLDYIPIQNQNLFGIDAFAVSLYYDNILYIASGMYQWDKPTYIMKSLDYGKTFKPTGNILPNNVSIILGGNEQYRWTRSKMCIHPDPNKNKNGRK